MTLQSRSHEARDVVRIGVIVGTDDASVGAWHVPAAVLPSSYIRSIEGAGGLPIAFPATDALVERPQLLLDLVDAVVLAGGRDVDPACYGASRHPGTDPSDRLRDAVELAVVRAALESDLPVLAICRGMQVLNIAVGGTIEQHLPDRLGHRNHAEKPGSFGRHAIRIVEGSRLAQVYENRDDTAVHTYHHQGIDALGDGLVAVAYSDPDDVVEAVESITHNFVLGVQWHPEQDEQTPLFAALIAHVRDRRPRVVVGDRSGTERTAR